MAKSRKASSRRARSHRCKYGMLKHPVKTPSGGKRICKKSRSQKYGGNKGDESKSRRDYSKSHSGKGLSLAELKKIAKENGIKRYSSLKRASLKAKLTRAGIKEHMSHHKSHEHSRKHSRNHSKRKSRSRRRRSCKHGVLKTPVKTTSGGKRYCKKKSRSRKHSEKKSRSRKHSEKKSRSRKHSEKKSRSRKHSKKKSRSRKHSKKKSRSRRCKYGMLKHAVKTPSGRKRVCRKSRGPHRKSKKKSRSRKHSEKKSHKRSKKKSHKRSKKKSRSRRRRSCKFGMLKTPMKTTSGGKRYCKKRRSQK